MPFAINPALAAPAPRVLVLIFQFPWPASANDFGCI